MQTSFEVCNMSFVDIYTLEQELLDFKTALSHRFLCRFHEFHLLLAHRFLILIVLFFDLIFLSLPVFIFFLETITIIGSLTFKFIVLFLNEFGQVSAIHGFTLELHLKIEAHSSHFSSAFFVFFLFGCC